MKMMQIDQITPDPNQPRRTFNEEKMQALEASMRTDGFRQEYPIIINGGNTIVDGERRWKAAKAVGIKEVPVEVKENVTPAQRLLYQLQSEGVELDFIERNKAWARLGELSKGYITQLELSEKLGVSEDQFKRIVSDYKVYQEALDKAPKGNAASLSYETLVEVGREDKEVVEKAAKEEWTRDKAREIRQAIKERPLRKQQILSQDYSDPYEGSDRWKLRLEVAKSDVDIEEMEELDETRQEMQGQVDAYDRIVEYAFKLKAAMDKFDYTQVTPQTRVKLHSSLSRAVPVSSEWFEELTKFMTDRGEIVSGVYKELEGGKNE